MATCLITEASGQHKPSNKGSIPVIRPGATQSVTYTTSTASTAFGEFTNVIRVIADADVYLAFGSAPTATATAVKVPSGTVEYFGVRPGWKVACYDGSS